jgi:hypothetical protein
MNLGTCMGIFWIFKFTLLPLGLQYSFLLLAYIILTAAVPVVGYKYVANYRDKVCGGSISFSHACWFTMMMYMFAAMLTSVAHYIYFAFIDNGYLVNKMTAVINMALTVSPVSPQEKETLDEALDMFSALTPADFTLQYLSSDIFFCCLLAVPTALLVMRKNGVGAQIK